MPGIIGHLNEFVPELEMVVGNVHLGYILNKLALVEQFANNANREIPGRGIGISADVIGDQDTASQVFDNIFDTAGTRWYDQVSNRS